MKNKSIALLTAFSVAIMALAICEKSSAQTSRPAVVAKGISKEEAMKQYPPPPGGYPVATHPMTPGASPGFYESPYPPNRTFDCREIKKGQLVIDPFAKKAFALP